MIDENLQPNEGCQLELSVLTHYLDDAAKALVKVTPTYSDILLDKRFWILLLASTAGAPYFKLATEAFENREFGIFLGICTLIGEAAISIWAYFNLFENIEINEVVGNINGKTSHFSSFLFYTSILVLTLFAQIPNTYISFKYNGNNYIFAAITFLNDFGLRFYAIETLFNKLANLQIFPSDESTSQEVIRNNLIKQFQESCEFIINNCNHSALIRKLFAPNLQEESADFEGSSPECIRSLSLLTLLLSTSAPPDIPNIYLWSRWIFTKVCYLLPTAVLAFQLKETVAFSSQFGFIWEIILPIVSILPLVYLEYSVLDYRMNSMFDNSVGRLCGVFEPEYLQTKFPRTITIMSLLALFVGCFTFGPRVGIIRNDFSGKIGEALGLLVILGAMIFESNALIDVVHGALSHYFRKNSNEEIKIKLLLKELTNKVSKLFAGLSKEKVIKLINELKIETNSVEKNCSTEEGDLDFANKSPFWVSARRLGGGKYSPVTTSPH